MLKYPWRRILILNDLISNVLFKLYGIHRFPKVFNVKEAWPCILMALSMSTNWSGQRSSRQTNKTNGNFIFKALATMTLYIWIMCHVFSRLKGSCHQKIFWLISCKICSWGQCACAWSHGWKIMFLASKSSQLRNSQVPKRLL